MAIGAPPSRRCRAGCRPRRWRRAEGLDGRRVVVALDLEGDRQAVAHVVRRRSHRAPEDARADVGNRPRRAGVLVPAVLAPEERETASSKSFASRPISTWICSCSPSVRPRARWRRLWRDGVQTAVRAEHDRSERSPTAQANDRQAPRPGGDPGLTVAIAYVECSPRWGGSRSRSRPWLRREAATAADTAAAEEEKREKLSNFMPGILARFRVAHVAAGW